MEARADEPTDDLPDKTEEHRDKTLAATLPPPERTLEGSSSTLTETAPQRKAQPPMEGRSGGVKAFGPNGRFVVAANERTKEFLERAFELGVLFPDSNPRFAGAIDFHGMLLGSEDWRKLVHQYFPSGTFAVINVSTKEGIFIYALSTTNDPSKGPLSITGSISPRSATRSGR